MRYHRRAASVASNTPVTPAQAHFKPTDERLHERLDALLPPADKAPEALHRAMRYAVLSGGKRLRPRLLLAVAAARGGETLGDAEVDLALNAASAIELLHAASLIHDDLPAFDDSPMRRGRPTVHIAFGEPLAILAGDALLSRAFEVIAESPLKMARRALTILRLMGAAAGSCEGIIGGQSMEQDLPAASGSSGGPTATAPAPRVIDRYHSMKSAALFRLAAEAGAVVARHARRAGWAQMGHDLGLAFQLADDLYDASGHTSAGEKPRGRDAARGRPNAAMESGPDEARHRMWALFQRAHDAALSLSTNPRPIAAFLAETGRHLGFGASI